MKSWSRSAVLASMLLVIGSCSGTDPVGDGADSELLDLYRSDAFFELRDVLDTLPELRGAVPALVRAEVAHAFNEPERSNRYLRELEQSEALLPDSLLVKAHRLRFRNHVRLHEYGAALDAARDLLALPAADSVMRADVENEVRVMRAIRDVSPQRVSSRGASTLQRLPNGRIPVQVGDSSGGYVFDTGANLSTMIRSEAARLGLAVRTAEVQVGTSTGSFVTADVTVAPRVRVGNVEIENVVFLVVPDELLTFSPAFRIPGIIGFPVIDALGEVEFRQDGSLRIPAAVPGHAVQNLALRYLTPLIRLKVLGEEAVCDLDTGANRTSLHLPFYTRHRGRVEAEGELDTIRTAGAGGERRIPAYVLRDVRVAIGDTGTVLADVPAYTQSVATGEETPSDCRLGLDAFAGFDGYLINLRSMTFLPL